MKAIQITDEVDARGNFVHETFCVVERRRRRIAPRVFIIPARFGMTNTIEG